MFICDICIASAIQCNIYCNLTFPDRKGMSVFASTYILVSFRYVTFTSGTQRYAVLQTEITHKRLLLQYLGQFAVTRATSYTNGVTGN